MESSEQCFLSPAALMTQFESVAECGRPVVVAIDGRSGSGKSTLARRMAEGREGVAIVATDDVAWHESFFEWGGLLIRGVLGPLRASGPPVGFRPPAWQRLGRPGAIEIPAETRTIILEGVGAGRDELSRFVDHVIWIHIEPSAARARLLARGCSDGRPESPRFVDDWLEAEQDFLDVDRPWERADVVVDAARTGRAGALSVVRR
nr:hypothetical protein [Gordonia sp. LAM0048]